MITRIQSKVIVCNSFCSVEATTGSQDTARKLQFLRVLAKDFMEKMVCRLLLLICFSHVVFYYRNGLTFLFLCVLAANTC
jgi:hypothetical protein